jgi:hypothetical protein
VLVATALFVFVLLFSPRSGLITTRVARALHHPHPERDDFADEPGSSPAEAFSAGTSQGESQ